MAEAIYKIADDGEGTTVAVGANGLILVSTDGGESWTQRYSGTTNTLHGVVFGYAYDTPRWVIVGQNGLILTSPDTQTWSVQTPFTAEALYGVGWGGVFIAVGATGVLGLSDDLGQTWAPKSSNTTVDLFDIDIGESLYTIVGDEDTAIVGSLATLEKEALVVEDIDLRASQSETGTFQHPLSVGFAVVDDQGDRHHLFLYDGVRAGDYGDDPTGSFNHTALEAFDLLTTFLGHVGFRERIIQKMSVTDTPAFLHRKIASILEELSASEIISVQDVVTIKEALSVLTPISYGGSTLHRTLTQSLSLRESVVVSWILLVQEQIMASDQASRDPVFLASVAERLAAAGAVETMQEAVAAVALSVTFSEAVEGGKGADAQEAFQLTGEVLHQARATLLLIEQALLTETPDPFLRLLLPVSEQLDLDAEPSAAALLQQAVQEGVAFQLSFGLDGQTYTGWVMNTQNFAVTQYQSYPFNSFAQHQGIYLGANEQGIYRLDAADDDGLPIEATARLGITDFDEDVKKRLDSIYLGFRTDGTIIIKTLTEENTERWYEVKGATEKLHTRRVHPLAKALSSTYWQVELMNVDGADFEIDSIRFVPVMLSRRI